MARIKRVGHVVLHVSDLDVAVRFYSGVLGMEVVRHDPDRGMALMSFGTLHHDVGLFRVHGEETRGNLGLGHVGLSIDGGMNELKDMHDQLVGGGVDIDSLTDYGMVKSLNFHDPDGNGLEIYCDVMEPEEGKRFLSEGSHRPGPFTFEEVAATS